MLAEAEGACGELQQAASRLEGGLAELDRWSADALDSYKHQREKSHRGHSTSGPTRKVRKLKLHVVSNHAFCVYEAVK